MIAYTLPPGLTLSKFKDGSGEWPWYQGKPIRSVSKILNVLYPLPPGIPQWALDRGKAVHSASVMVDNKSLDWGALDERLKPFVDAYQSFLDTAHPVVEASELNVVHPSYKFGARLDRVYRLTGQDCLVVCDIKCGTGKEDRYFLQVAACALALDEANIRDYELALLNLDNRGNPHFTVADHPGSWVNRFREILDKDTGS